MAKYQLKNFKDIVDSIMEQLKLQASDTVSRDRIKRNVNMVYLNEVVPFKRWTWLRRAIDVQHQAYLNTGTASVTPGSQTVTLSSSLGFSRKGFMFSVDNDGEIYRIQSHVENSSVLQLEVPYAGKIQAAAKFRIWSDSIPLPSDAQELIEIRRDSSPRPVEAQSLQEFRRIQSILPKAEGFPNYYTVTDFKTPQSYANIIGLPATVSRRSSGLTKTIVFQSSLGSGSNLLLQPGDRIEITNVNERTYNGEWKVGAVSTTTFVNDTITLTGLLPLQEGITADPTIIVKREAPQSDNRYRELLIYPSITNVRANLHIDYIRSVEPLVEDTDEPKMAIEDRIVLYHGGLSWSWNRERNPEEAQNSERLFKEKLARMAGKTEDQPEKPILMPKNEYLRMKRSSQRQRMVVESGFGGGGGGGGGGGVVTGSPNTVAVFNSVGELESQSDISTEELSYLDGLTSNIQDQIDVLGALPDGQILIGNSSNVTTPRTVSGDISLNNTGVASITPGAIIDADINPAAGIDATKLGDGSVSNTELGYLSGVTSDIQTQIDSKLDGSLLDGQIFVGSALDVPEAVSVTGDITLSNTGVTAIASGAIVDDDINSSAGIARSKLANGTASHVIINDGSGVLSSEAQLSGTRGGTGVSSTATFPTSGVVVTEDGASTLTNKQYNVLNTLAAEDDTTTGSAATLTLPSASVVVLTDNALTSLAGVVAPSESRLAVIKNSTGAAIDLLNDDTGASATNRILTGTGSDLSLSNGAAATIAYDSVADRWQVVGGSGGGSSANFGRTTFSGITPHAAAFGTVVNEFYYYWRVNNQVFIEGQFQAGTIAADLAYIDLSGIEIDDSLMYGDFTVRVGDLVIVSGNSTVVNTTPYVAYYDGTDTDRIYFTVDSQTGVYRAYNASAIAESSSYWQFRLSFPVVGWS